MDFKCPAGQYRNCSNVCETITSASKYLCNGVCQDAHLPCGQNCPSPLTKCNGTCQTYEKPCSGLCSSFHFEPQSGYMFKPFWRCGGQCLKLTSPCNNSKCFQSSEKCPGENKCIKHQRFCNIDNIDQDNTLPNWLIENHDLTKKSRKHDVSLTVLELILSVDFDPHQSTKSGLCMNNSHIAKQTCDLRSHSKINVFSCDELYIRKIPCPGGKTLQCISSHSKCDGILNCMDRSDESQCPRSLEKASLVDYSLFKDCKTVGNETG